MLKDAREKIELARKGAVRLQKLSEAVHEAERKRDTCLYNLFDDLRGIQICMHELTWKDKRKLFGDLLNFRSARNVIGLVLRQIYPELGRKSISKYAAVLRYVTAAKPRQENVKEFVRRNGGINGCVTKEKKSRPPARRS